VQYRQLGTSDLVVSEIALGSWLTYGVGVDTASARACVDRAFEVGINFLDTANVYGRGAAETFLGEALAARDRASYVLATKLYFPMSDEDRGLSAAQVRKQIDASLRRLRTDHVDLYQCHRYDPQTPLEETLEALTEVVRQGKARYLGFSEWTAAQIRTALAIPGPRRKRRGRGREADAFRGLARQGVVRSKVRASGFRSAQKPESALADSDLAQKRAERFVSSQPEYSILQRRIEAEVIPLCAANGISQIVFSPLAQGVLTGKYRPGDSLPEDSRAASDSMGWAMSRFLDEDVLEAVQRLRPIAEGLGITMAQLALAWVLREENVASAIVGASRPEQVDENAAASGIELDASTLAAIDDAVGDVVRRS
jgi:aryl-alcohol dehydrogenase-like predicted oxidoreductase